MDEFSVTVSAVGRDKKDKEVLELLEDLPIAVEDQQVSAVLTQESNRNRNREIGRAHV